MAKQTINYVNDSDLHKCFIEWHESDPDLVKIPDKISKDIMLICENLAKSAKFSGYTWKEDMIADAIFCCIKFVRNFDPEKFNKPFAYFSKVAWNAFLHRISVENNRIAGLLEYKDQMSTIYDCNEYEEDDEYSYIEQNAKSANRIYLKSKKEKSKKQKPDAMSHFLE